MHKDKKIAVINLSLGGYAFSHALQDAIRYATYAGIPIVAKVIPTYTAGWHMLGVLQRTTAVGTFITDRGASELWYFSFK